MALPKRVKKFFSILGPGVITGAAGDDPSGIATYSISGAQLGTSLLWTAWLTWPLMAGVQMMCARIGLATNSGLAKMLGKKFPRWMVGGMALMLLVANVVNIAADLSGMADASNLVTGVNSVVYIILFGLGIALAVVRFSFYRIEAILKWLAICLLAYIATAFMIHVDWGQVAKDSLIPTMPKGHDGWSTLVALLGTTISPYLFFWQSAQEVEEKGEVCNVHEVAIDEDYSNRAIDVGVGTFLSNAVMFFVILTAAYTLNKTGQTNIETSRQAAEALKPFAGQYALWLYTLGIVGVGLIAIPSLAASSAYAFGDMFGWPCSLNKKIKEARAFYMVIIASCIGGVLLNFIGIKPMDALIGSAIINGVIAPFLLVGILLVARDNKLMHGKASSKLNQAVVGITALFMFAAGITMFVM